MVHLYRFTQFFLSLILAVMLSPVSGFAQAQISELCSLQDYQAVNGHSIYLDNLPGAPSPQFIFDAQGGQLTIFNDGTANITGTVQHETQSNLQWEVDIWLINQSDFNSWTALGRDFKVELAPLPIVNANVQDWTFYELDDTRSTLTGVPGTFYDGDVLNLSHRPSNLEFGFQLGIGANAKNGSDGISGWFFYSGAYSGIGDVNANRTCGAPPCDVDITQVDATCVNDSTFEVSVTFTGTGNQFEISDNQGSPVLSGLSAGTHVFNTYSNNTNVVIIVSDMSIVSCADTAAAVTQDCTPAPVCDVAIDSLSSLCLNDTSFEVNVYVSGTGNYTISDNQGSATQNGGAGTYTFGPYANNASVSFTATDDNIAQCSDSAGPITKDCAPPPVCDVAIDSLSSACLNDTSFEVIVYVSGTGNYTISDDQGSATQNGGAGTYTFGPYANNTSVSFTATDDNIAQCSDSAGPVTKDCAPPPVCDVAIDSLSSTCLNDSSFEVMVYVSGTGNYSISDDQGSSAQSGGAGTYTFGPYASNTTVSYSAVDVNDTTCRADAGPISQDCTPVPVCDPVVDSLEAICITDSTFNVRVLISGSGTYNVLDNQGSAVQSGPAGTFIFGPYRNNLAVLIVIRDPAVPGGCQVNAGPISQDCTPAPQCDVSIDSVTTSCLSDSTFEVSFVLSGSSTYEVGDDQGSASLIAGAGNYSFGPYANNAAVSFFAIDINDTTCRADAGPITADCTPDTCAVNIDLLVAECVSDSSFEVMVSFSGVGNNFTISDNVGSTPIGGFSPGTYAFGDYFNSTDVTITVSDSSFAGCTSTFGPVTADCTPVPVCDLVIDTAYTNCITDSTFEAVISFSGTGGFYELSDNAGTPGIPNLSAGMYTFGVYPNGTSVQLRVNNFAIFNCFAFTDTLTANCDSTTGGFSGFTSFDSKTEGRNVELTWSSPLMDAGTYYEVERKEENGIFRIIGLRTLSEMDLFDNKYYYTDYATPTNKRLSYRIKQIRNNGQISYSPVLETIRLNRNELMIGEVFPNPTNEEAKILMNAGSPHRVVCKIVDMKGAQVSLSVLNTVVGSQELQLPASDLRPGLYLVKLKLENNKEFVRKLVITE